MDNYVCAYLHISHFCFSTAHIQYDACAARKFSQSIVCMWVFMSRYLSIYSIFQVLCTFSGKDNICLIQLTAIDDTQKNHRKKIIVKCVKGKKNKKICSENETNVLYTCDELMTKREKKWFWKKVFFCWETMRFQLIGQKRT